MRILLIAILTVISVSAFSQKSYFGISMGTDRQYSKIEDKVKWDISSDVFYQWKHSRISLGGAYQFGGQAGKAVSSRRANYGNTITGSGVFFYTGALGYSYILGKFTAGVFGEIGSQRYYQNYQDLRFTGGGYYVVTQTEFIKGIGGNIGFRPIPALEIYLQASQIRQFGAGLRILLPTQY